MVDSPQHPALAAYNASAQAGGSSHFVKLPMLRHFLAVYDQVLFIDDDVLLSPFAPDLFAQVDCSRRIPAWALSEPCLSQPACAGGLPLARRVVAAARAAVRRQRR